MILPVHDRVRDRIREVLRSGFGLSEADIPPIVIETPPNRALGDLAVTVAFELARKLRKAPKVIAQDLSTQMGPIDGVARVQVAPNGFLNLFLDRTAFLTGQLSSRPARADRRHAGTRARPRHAGARAGRRHAGTESAARA